MSKALDIDLLEARKKSLGYYARFSTLRQNEITGREWVYTATSDEMRVLFDIERMIAGITDPDHHYSFFETHFSDFDGYVLTVRETGGGRQRMRRYEGFPKSATAVLAQFHDIIREMQE